MPPVASKHIDAEAFVLKLLAIARNTYTVTDTNTDRDTNTDTDTDRTASGEQTHRC